MTCIIVQLITALAFEGHTGHVTPEHPPCRTSGLRHAPNNHNNNHTIKTTTQQHNNTRHHIIMPKSKHLCPCPNNQCQWTFATGRGLSTHMTESKCSVAFVVAVVNKMAILSHGHNPAQSAHTPALLTTVEQQWRSVHQHLPCGYTPVTHHSPCQHRVNSRIARHMEVYVPCVLVSLFKLLT